jgi:hypothetical protein
VDKFGVEAQIVHHTFQITVESIPESVHQLNCSPLKRAISRHTFSVKVNKVAMSTMHNTNLFLQWESCEPVSTYCPGTTFANRLTVDFPMVRFIHGFGLVQMLKTSIAQT